MNRQFENIMVLRMDAFSERLRCPVCGSACRTLVSKRTTFTRVESLPKGMVALHPEVERARKLYRCSACGLKYLSHIPAQASLEVLWDHGDILHFWPQDERPAFSRGRDTIETLLPQGKVILDVGAHTGGFLSTLSSRWQKHALEPMASSSLKIESAEIYRGYLENAALPDGSFDCVSVFDVLEHLRDPDTALANVSRSLRPGGIVVIETGNAESLGARLLGGGWYYLNYLEHFHAFSPRSLELLLRKHGMQQVACRRVYHEKTTAAQISRVAVFTVLYVALTIGNQPGGWRRFLKTLRPGHTGAPPITGALEPDHLFVVARKS